ncbi:MAG: aminopeptidase P family N-terminal domain-containing protein, partial [Rhodospirillales bacterium]|nr:aminopeptidase P family N-terminal domain-containing protein [Rhodospirillales bacterium]
MTDSPRPKSVCRMTYQGDEALAKLLAKNDATADVAAVRAIVAGVLSTPPALDPRAWHALVCARPTDALAAQLDALHAEMAGGRDDGLGEGCWRRARVDALRAELAKQKLDGFVLPRGDEHQGEYVSPRAERLEWLTGFTGSAGACVVLADRAAMFVDGRYTLQVRTQVDAGTFEYRHLVEEPPSDWLAANAPKDGRIGYDPWFHSSDSVERLRQACERAGAKLVPVQRNPVDAVWQGQPVAPLSPARPHPIALAGKSSEDKRAELAAKLRKDGIAAAVVTAPDSLAWLLNIRGADVPHTPLALGFAILHADENRPLDLFIDGRKLILETRAHLGNRVRVAPVDALDRALEALGAEKARVLTDRLTASAHIDQLLAASGAVLVRDACVCALPKACKNPQELAGTRA